MSCTAVAGFLKRFSESCFPKAPAFATFLLLSSLPAGRAVFASGVPESMDADTIIGRAVARTEWVEEHAANCQYAFVRSAVTDEISNKGNVKERKEKVYSVVPMNNGTYSRLMTVNGKALTGEDLRQEQEREKKARTRGEKDKPFKGGRDMGLNRELVSRFNYTLKGEELIRGRRAFVLAFSPKDCCKDEEDLVSRILSKVAGNIWIDAEDFEVAEVRLKLQEKVTIGWGGLLASIGAIDCQIQRTRLPEGTWQVFHTEGELTARQLFISKHFKHREDSRDFRKAIGDSASK